MTIKSALKRVVVGVTVGVLALSNLAVGVSADDYYGMDAARNNRMYAESEIDVAREAWEALKAHGATDTAIAGALGNAYQESGWNPASRGSNGGGLFAWIDGEDTTNWTRFNNWVTSNSREINETATQCDFLWEDNSQFAFCWKSSVSGGPSYSAIFDGRVDYSAIVDTQTYFTTDFESPGLAAEVFCWGFENCGFSESYIIDRAAIAEAIFDELGGTITGGNRGDGNSGEQGTFNVAGGYWAEEEFVSVNQLLDSPVPLPDAETLDAVDRNHVVEWREQLEMEQEQQKYRVVRGIVSFVGILVILYSVFLYIAFQFDVNQNFFDFEFIGVMTMGRLRIAQEYDKSTYKEDNAGKKLVTHRDIIGVCLLGIALGVLIISGKLYAFIYQVIFLVKDRLS